MMVFAIQRSIEHEDDYGISYTHDTELYRGVYESREDAQAYCDEYNEPLIKRLVTRHVNDHRQKYSVEARSVAEHNALVDAGLRTGVRRETTLVKEPPPFVLPEDYANRYKVIGVTVKPASNREETPS